MAVQVKCPSIGPLKAIKELLQWALYLIRNWLQKLTKTLNSELFNKKLQLRLK